MKLVRRLLRFVAGVAVASAALVGSIIGLLGIGLLADVIRALTTGTFTRDDLLEATGKVSIVRVLDPGRFWDDVMLWTVGALFGLMIAWVLTAPAYYAIRSWRSLH